MRRRRVRARRRGFGVLLALLASGAWPGRPALGQTTPERMRMESRALTRAARLEREGDAPAAIRVLETLLDRVPGSVSGLAVLQRLRSEEGRPGLLLPYVERAVEASAGARPAIMQVWIRALLAAGREDSAQATAERWTRSAPREAMAFLELASVLRQRGRQAEAIEVLTDGRQRLGAPEAFAQELGRLRTTAGEFADAAGDWTIMLSWGQPGRDVVARQIGEPSIDSAAARAALWSRLERPDTPFDAVRSGIELALRLPDPSAARRLAEVAANRAPEDARLALLSDFTLGAANRDMPGNAAWGASLLAREARTADERLQWRAMAADLALEAGDEARARREFGALSREARPGSEAHRTALIRGFEFSLEDPDGARARLRDFRRFYPSDDEALAAMVVDLSESDLARGDVERARADLDLISRAPADPATALRLLRARGYLSLFSGRPGLARAQLGEAAAAGGDPATRSRVLDLTRALGRADSLESVALGSALLSIRRRPRSASAREILEAWASLSPSAARSALLAVAADELAARGLEAEAAVLRERIVQRHPGSPEAPAALLDLARLALSRDTAQARARLERLIVDYPRSALAPLARRLLAELEGAVPSS